jgi:pimeloyl-ACP methyl ester carboxylesterase
METAMGRQDDRLTRRRLFESAATLLAPVLLAPPVRALGAGAQSAPPQGGAIGPYDPAVLPAGVRSRFVDNGNGIRMHVLEAGYDVKGREAVILLHGFPELAYSWRRVIPAVASAGYHVIAPDLRGYGRTSGTDVKYDDDLTPFHTLNEVRDILGLVSAFGYRNVAAVIGHDFGAPVAGWCALARPDVFRSVVMMSAPFGGPPSFPFGTADSTKPAADTTSRESIYDDLAKLTPPRQHYQRYYATREANDNLWKPPQGVHALLRAYYHMKSADWQANKPYPLKAWTASELAKLPNYYVMPLGKGMAESVAPEMPSAAEIAKNKWLPDNELKVYSTEYGRTGFQGGLQGYRIGSSGRFTANASNARDLLTLSGRTIDVPSMFIAGKSDWGTYQRPGAFETMQKTACTQMVGVHLVEGAGHWVQQEQAETVNKLLIQFLQGKARRSAV